MNAKLVAAQGFFRELSIEISRVPTYSKEEQIGALRRLDYQPRAPVPFEDFGLAEKRDEWVRTKHMRVFSAWSPRYPLTEIDLFLNQPFDDFGAAFARGVDKELAPGLVVHFVGRDDLLAMKREAGRPKDNEDVRVLEALGTDEGNQ